MKNKIFVVMISLLCLALEFSVVVAADEQKGIAAIVNGVPVYSVEIEQEVLTVLPISTSFHGKMSAEKMGELRKEAMERILDNELKYQDAIAKGVKLSNEERDAAIKKNTGRFKNESELESAIKEAGFTRASFEHFIERPLVAALITKKEVDEKVRTTDEMVKKYYETNKSSYNKPKEFRASHILFKVDPSISTEDKNKIRLRAEAVLKKIKDGADFADVAAKESDDMSFIKGGDLGYFHAGQILAELEKPLDSMKVGDMSGLIESLYGYHLVKLTDMRPPRLIPFEEIKVKIKKDLINSEKKRLKDQWISGITKKAVITYPVAK